MDIFDQIAPEGDIFDQIAPEGDIFDQVAVDNRPAPGIPGIVDSPLGSIRERRPWFVAAPRQHPLLQPVVDVPLVADPQSGPEGVYNALGQGLAAMTSPVGALLPFAMTETVVPRAIATLTKMGLAGMGAHGFGGAIGTLTGTPDPTAAEIGQVGTEAALNAAMMLPFAFKVGSALRPRGFGEVLPPKPDVPVTPRMLEDIPIDVEASVVRGNALPPGSRFVRHPGGAWIDTTQLTPSEQNVMYEALARQVARDILEIQARQTRPKQGEPVVLGEQPQPKEVVIVPPVRPQPVRPQTIIPAYQAAGEAKQGGLISFAGEAGGLPNARQQAVDLGPKPTEQEMLMRQSFVPSKAKPETKPEPLVRLADILERIEKILPREGVEQESGVTTPAVTSQAKPGEQVRTPKPETELPPPVAPERTQPLVSVADAFKNIEHLFARGSQQETVSAPTQPVSVSPASDVSPQIGSQTATTGKDITTGKDLVAATPQEVVAWRRRVKYSPATSRKIAQTITDNDIPVLRAEMETLRKQSQEALSKARPDDDTAILRAGELSLKAQTINEVLRDYETTKGGETHAKETQKGQETSNVLTPQPGLQVKAAMERGRARRSETGALNPTGAEGRLSPKESPLQTVRVLLDKTRIGFAETAKVAGQQLWNRLKNVLGKDSSELKVLEETTAVRKFLEEARTPKEVAEFIAENGPRVEVHSYGMEGKMSEARREYDRMTHEWFDTELPAEWQRQLLAVTGPNYTVESAVDYLKNKSGIQWSKEGLEKAKRYIELTKQVKAEPHDTSLRATSAYETVSAFDTREPMPEWTTSAHGANKQLNDAPRNVQRVDVVVPQRFIKRKIDPDYDGPQIRGATEEMLWQPDNLHENLPNTLGWATIQYKTGPNGEKIAFIAEAQSRWGQTQRNLASEFEVRPYEERTVSDPKRGIEATRRTRYGIWDKTSNSWVRPERREIYKEQVGYSTKDAAQEALRDYVKANVPDHPLLRDYNRLILKAAIEQARKEGATHIVVSDAETAMMTEGHDLHRTYESDYEPEQLQGQYTKYGEKDNPIIVHQEPGMRLNYDKILPSIMEELTGKKGEAVSLGVHKNALDEYKVAVPATQENKQAVNRWIESQTFPDEEAEIVKWARGNSKEPWIMGKDAAKTLGLNYVNLTRKDLIFRNPDGTPKTTVTGRMYPLPSTEFTIMGKDKAPKALEAPRGEAGLAKNLRKEGGMTQQGEKGMLNLDVVKEAVDKLFAPIRFYSEPLVERLGRLGGPVSKQVSKEAQQIVARAKEFYGKLTPTLDEAKKAAGRLIGPGSTGGTTWARGIQKITDKAAVNNIFAANEGRITVPKKAQELVDRFNAANREIGALAATASPGFTPSGKLQRMLTAYGIDVVRRGGGPAWEAWTRGVARANGASVADVQRFYRRWKRELDEAGPDVAALDRINQDFRRQFPNTVTHIKVANAWHEVLVSDPFAYLEVAAQRTAHAAAFREVYKPGTGLLENTRRAVQAELQTHRFEKEFDSLMRALQGHPTDSYTAWWNAPDSALGQAGRMTTATLMAPMRALVLTGNAITNFAESIIGGPAIFLGYRNVIPAMWKLPSFYKQLEMNGALNKALQNYAFDPTSPVRSTLRMASNVVRMTSFQQVLNEFQEATAAATARIVANRIRNNDMSSYELERVKAVMNQMGLDGTAGIKGNEEVLSQFERKAASWLTAGNQAMAERSRLGTSRLFNELFWFHSYPMMTMNQLRANMEQLVKAIEAGDKKQARHQATLLARQIGGKTLQGVMLTALLALVFEGIDGVEERKQEAKDETLEFLWDSWLAAQGGPLTVIKRTLEQSGDSRSLQNAIAATSTPVSIGSEWYDAVLGNGRYEGLTANERVAKFVTSKTPGWRIIKTVMAVSGLSNEDLELQTALKAFYRWRRKELGAKSVVNLGPQDETDVQFRAKMRRAVEAIRKGEDWRKELRGESAERAFNSMLARRVLRAPDGGKLSEEQLNALRSRIGDKLVDRLEEHDEMLRLVAYEIVGRRAPREQREKRPSRRQERVIE